MAADIPVAKLPGSPGPTVTATADNSSGVTPAFSNASLMTPFIATTCCLLAIPGTTPPHFACNAIWLDTTEDITVKSSCTIAAAVSSQDDSIAKSICFLSMINYPLNL